MLWWSFSISAHGHLCGPARLLSLPLLQGAFRAICGGGRYDRLLDHFTAKDKKTSPNIPAVGFGFGDAVIMELLKSKNLLPDMTQKSIVDVVVCYLAVGDNAVEDQKKLQMLAVKAATELRKNGFAVDLILENKKAKWMFQRADKLNAGKMACYIFVYSVRLFYMLWVEWWILPFPMTSLIYVCNDFDLMMIGYTLMFATEELGDNGVVLKDMKQGSQIVIDQDDIVGAVSSALSLSELQQGGRGRWMSRSLLWLYASVRNSTKFTIMEIIISMTPAIIIDNVLWV